MNAFIDSYTQVSIRLSRREAEELKAKNRLDGVIIRTSCRETLPLRLKVSEGGWRAEGVPVRAPYEKKKAYEIDMPPQGPDEILSGKCIGTDQTAVRLRKVYISLDSVL